MTVKTPKHLNLAKASPREAPRPILTLEAKTKKILIVDDDPQILESLGKVLRTEGYAVVLAADGREGIRKFNTERIDLLLLDVNLPDMSGWDVFGAVTSLNPCVPILIITGRNDQKPMVTLSGACALIEKPPDVPRLLQTIAEMLAESPETHLKRLVGLHRSVRQVPQHIPFIIQ